MRFISGVIALACAALTAQAQAIPYIPPPQPVYEAPIDRALANVAATEGIEEAQRERLLGRLNLLAYARDNGNFAYLSDTNELNEAGAIPCSEAPPPMVRGGPGGKPQTFPPGARCARLDFNLAPQLEVPESASRTQGEAGRARLVAAEGHYARAIALEGENLRARLGHAYTLDRLGRLNEARSELRRILQLGLPQLSGPQSNWETHVVLTEAAAHLAHLARNKADRRKLEQLRARLQASRPMMYVTPIVVPLTDEPFEALVDRGARVAFDFAGTGDKRAQGWLTRHAAWLVWDPQGRGEVRSGFDLIGARTWAVFWRDGFEALASLDDDRSGEVAGEELGGLALWRDANRNGISDPGEVRPLRAHGIVALSTRGASVRPDLISAPGGVRFADGRTRPLHDWTPGVAEAVRVASAPALSKLLR
ncbi:MAG: hypothetical protein JNJ73_17200 [Hyphomonadaceae bacterium]|nr:hypothetical protein [Hyphomonadaceae bacterium]